MILKYRELYKTVNYNYKFSLLSKSSLLRSLRSALGGRHSGGRRARGGAERSERSSSAYFLVRGVEVSDFQRSDNVPMKEL